MTFPLIAPAVANPRHIEMGVDPFQGYNESPFSGSGQVYDWMQQKWYLQFNLPPIKNRRHAERWVSEFLLGLNGMVGSFLFGQTGYINPQGTWSGGSPLVKGASQTGNALIVDGMADGIKGIAGDMFQLGSGATARLHKLRSDFVVAAGQATLDFTPRLRYSPADNAALVLTRPQGLFMLAPGQQSRWTIDLAMVYGLSFQCMEDLRGI